MRRSILSTIHTVKLFYLVTELLRLQVQDVHFNPNDKPFHEKAIKALLRKLKREKNRGNQVLFALFSAFTLS